MVDAADLKSVVRMDVPVQVRPGPPFTTLIVSLKSQDQAA